MKKSEMKKHLHERMVELANYESKMIKEIDKTYRLVTGDESGAITSDEKVKEVKRAMQAQGCDLAVSTFDVEHALNNANKFSWAYYELKTMFETMFGETVHEYRNGKGLWHDAH